MSDGGPQAQRLAELGAEWRSRLTTLPDKPQETVEATLQTLWHLAAGRPLSLEAALEIDTLPALDAAADRQLQALIEQRAGGVPLAHLTGRQRFMGQDMLAGAAALIPRAETELLGQAALALVQTRLAEVGRATVVDVCTGSGNLALAIAAHAPGAQVHASDLSDDAVELARRNAAHLGVADRVDLRVGDLLEPFDQPAFHGAVDVLICNPPYISSGKVDTMHHEISAFEPRLAFDGGPLGVRILQRLIREAPRFLAPQGWLAFEVGEGQGPAVLRRLDAGGVFVRQRSVRDARGEIRAIIASR
jgi:release factor glutamine methyltransferase